MGEFVCIFFVLVVFAQRHLISVIRWSIGLWCFASGCFFSILSFWPVPRICLSLLLFVFLLCPFLIGMGRARRTAPLPSAPRRSCRTAAAAAAAAPRKEHLRGGGRKNDKQGNRWPFLCLCCNAAPGFFRLRPSRENQQQRGNTKTYRHLRVFQEQQRAPLSGALRLCKKIHYQHPKGAPSGAY